MTTTFRRSLSLSGLLVSLLTFTTACGPDSAIDPPDETPDDGNTKPGGGGKPDVTPEEDGAPKSKAVAVWGIGDRWYDYGENHTVTPQNASWLIVGDDAPVHLTVESFYGPTGDSSMPSMTIRRFVDGAWTTVSTWESPRRVRDAAQCVRFDADPEVDCAGAYDLIWRTDVRPLPEAGFSISNPGFYIASAANRAVYRLETRTPPADPSAAVATAKRILSVLDDDAAPVLRNHFFDNPQHSVVQLGADLHIAQWRMMTDEDSITFEARCLRAKNSVTATGRFGGTTQTLTIQRQDLDTWTYVDLCVENSGPAVVEHASTLRAGGWVSNATFDLVIQKKDDTFVLWTAPESIFEGLRTTPFADVAPPAYLWEN